MKRESGVNPGQSRCCELHNVSGILLPLFCKGNGKALDPEVSQKTCKAYYFDGFEERPDEKNKTSDVFLFLFHSQFAVLLGSVFNYFAIIIRKRSMVRLTG